MSERRRRKQDRRARRKSHRSRVDHRQRRITDAALLAARAQGCVCDPNLRTEWPLIVVAHDDWCPLARAHEGDGQPYVHHLLIPELFLDDDGEAAA